MEISISVLGDKMSEIRQNNPIREKDKILLGQDENDKEKESLEKLKISTKDLISVLENKEGQNINLNDLIKEVIESLQNFQVFKSDELRDVLPAIYEKKIT